MIQSVTTKRPMKAGEELCTYYGYGRSEFPADFPWYFELKRIMDKEARLEDKEHARV